jgi:hypothetical protein
MGLENEYININHLFNDKNRSSKKISNVDIIKQLIRVRTNNLRQIIQRTNSIIEKVNNTSPNKQNPYWNQLRIEIEKNNALIKSVLVDCLYATTIPYPVYEFDGTSILNNTKEVIDQTQEKLDGKETHLKHKKAELSDIMSETEKEETFLLNKSAELRGKTEARLLVAYDRIRSSVRNGLAVVSIERGASAGSFFTIPPQTQMEIAARKKIITDEHSGRILVDGVLADEEKVKMDKLFASL